MGGGKEKKKREKYYTARFSLYLIFEASHTSDPEAFLLFQSLLKCHLKCTFVNGKQAA